MVHECLVVGATTINECFYEPPPMEPRAGVRTTETLFHCLPHIAGIINACELINRSGILDDAIDADHLFSYHIVKWGSPHELGFHGGMM